MLSFFGFVIIVILLFWISSVSNRVTVLEKKLKTAPVLPVAPEAPQVQHKDIFNAVPATAPEMPNGNLPESIIVRPQDDSAFAAGWLTKIGVLALVIGIGFFIKYAIDQGWISQWTRVILGFGLGALLCILGSAWKEKYKTYAAALTGGGLAVMYFSAYSAYQFYNLVPQAVALVFMVLISALGVYLAHSRKSLGLAALAVGGAYLTPLMLHTGVDQHTALFVYLSLLNITAVCVTFSFYSNELLFLPFLAAAFDFWIWGMNFYSKANSWPAVFFVAFTFLLFLVGGAASFRKAALAKILPADADKYLSILAILLGAFYSISIASILYWNFHDYLSIMGLLGSVAAFLAYALVDRLEVKQVNYCLAFVGTALLALACIWQFSGQTTDFMLVAFGLVLVIGGTALKRAELRVWGLLTLVGCVFAVLFTQYDKTSYVFILNSKFGLVLFETAALWFTGWMFGQTELTETEKQAAEAAHGIGSLLLWFGFSWELAQYYSTANSANTLNLMLSLWWIAYATVLVIFGAVAKSAIYKKIAMVIFVLAILKVFLYDVLNLDTAYRIVSFIVLGVILLTVSYSYQKNKEKITQFLGNQNK